ncbi:synaptojanin-1 [Parasteatoda tepidariorum]|uniref:synaptojanin-1 n=1 Tax=Parasteatoda tepidariorum TaxID=114398 RepID=UPI001C72375E|nr:synaptojanin-1 [Parasteatoda tepidariorum]
MTLGKTFRVYHRTKHEGGGSYFILLEQRNKNDALIFEDGYIRVLSSDEFESLKKSCSRLPDAYGCLGVLQMYQGDVTISYLVLVNSCLSVGKVLGSEIFRVTETNFVSLRNNPMDIERIQEVRKVLNSGTFYFSWCTSGRPLDLTLCEQRAHASSESDNRFFWNKTMHINFLTNGINCDEWLLKVICGGIEIRTIYVGHLQARGCIISRLSSERAGTRFNVRGTNDDGCVANFVETEQVIYLEDRVCSYVQIRGSVPLFWEQPGLQVGSHKVKLSRGSEAAAPSFDRHLTQILNRYGDQVILNLLGSKEGEAMLSKMFQSHHKVSRYCKNIPYIAFDYHAECRGGRYENINILGKKIAHQLESFSFFYKDSEGAQNLQKGTFRTNCLDCLDRTNNVQTYIGLEILQHQLHHLSIGDQPQILSRFSEVFKQMWIQNGDQVSKMYAGTGALEGRSKLKDGSRSVVRTIQNNLLDSSKQEAIDLLLLGNLLYNDIAERARMVLPPSMLNFPPGFLRTFYEKRVEFTSPFRIKLGVATWNVNGGQHFTSIVFKHQSMTEWLLDCPKLSSKSSLIDVTASEENSAVDIYAIGFEEIVDLNASNIVSASSEKQREWMTELQKTISRNNKYIYITSTQLVGVCLFVFALPKHAPFIRDVCIDAVKTGLGGTTGNKGGVGIRMSVYNTSMCFVCAHLAAGHSQIFERNADYQEISKKLSFPMGRNLDSHHYIFWCGDFNYRIDLPNDEVRKLAKAGNYAALLAADQLKSAQQARQAFEGFTEGPINFPCTYKYDVFSDDYDTSEKNRIPAYTDRVLYKKSTLPYENDEDLGRISFYGRAELKTSDHRPVIAYVDINVAVINGPKRLEVFQSLLESGPPDGTVIIHIENCNATDEFKYQLLERLFKEKNASIRIFQFDILVCFETGKDAIEALDYNNKEIDGCLLRVRLKSPEWQASICKILKLCQNNTTPLLSNILPPKPSDEESTFYELLNEDNNPDSADSSELNDHVLNTLDCHKEWHAIADDGSKCNSPVKVPPRPPAPVRPPASAPMRPPPPQRPQPPEKNVIQTPKYESEECQEHTTISNNDPGDNYKSCPPPSAPPPPPPDLSAIEKSVSKKKGESAVEGSDGVTAMAPPIPSRPKAPNRSSVGPPSLPARPTQPPAYLPPVAPRKSTQ